MKLLDFFEAYEEKKYKRVYSRVNQKIKHFDNMVDIIDNHIDELKKLTDTNSPAHKDIHDYLENLKLVKTASKNVSDSGELETKEEKNKAIAERNKISRHFNAILTAVKENDPEKIQEEISSVEEILEDERVKYISKSEKMKRVRNKMEYQ